MYFGENRQPIARKLPHNQPGLTFEPQPAAGGPPPVKQKLTGAKHRRLRPAPRSRKKYFYTSLFIGVLLTGALGGGLFVASRNTKPIPSEYRHGLSFPLYYPYNLPNGYSVNHTSFANPAAGVIEFSVHTPNGKNVAISEERIPVGVNLNQSAEPSGVQLPDAHSFTTGIGQAQISFWGSNLVCSIVAQDTWLILNVSGLSTQQATTIAQSFQPL